MSRFTIEEVTRREELDAVAECLWSAMAATEVSHQIFFPVLHGDVDAALAACQQTLWEQHMASPGWRFYSANPYADGVPQVVATGWPEGDSRRFASSYAMQCLAPRVEYMARPHSGLSWCAVLPEARRKGVGCALMEWGIRRTDELGLESWVEATPSGRGLYEAYGFRKVGRVNVQVKLDGESDEFRDIASRMLPSGYDSLWRPIRGVWKESGTEATWHDRMADAESSNK